MYKQCQMGKMIKSSFKSKTYCYDDILELVHTYLCGPIIVKCYYGDKYFILFADDFSRMMNMMFLKENYYAFQIFKCYLARVEKET